MNESTSQAEAPFWLRLLLAIPLVGQIANRLADGDDADKGALKAWCLVVAIILLWVGSTALFGLIGLYIPALILVVVVWVVLIVITRG